MSTNKVESLKDFRQHYEDHFTPKGYRALLDDLVGNMKHNREYSFFAQATAEFLANGNFKGIDLLVLGTGPHTLDVIPFAKHVDSITLCEFTTNCREEVKRWVKNDPEAVDFSYLAKTVCEVIGCADPEKDRVEAERLIRQKVEKVIYCDFLADHILTKEHQRPYDMVSSTGALGSSTKEIPVFKQIIKKINPLVKMGGYLLLKGFFNGQSWWGSGDTMFPYLQYTQKDLQEALEAAGFGQIEWKIRKADEVTFFQNDSSFFVSCVKKREVA